MKKKEILLVCLCQKKKKTTRPKRTKEFCSVWAGKRSASDNSSYIYNQEMRLEKLNLEKNENAVSVSRLKIPAESLQHANTVATIERDNNHLRRNARRKAR